MNFLEVVQTKLKKQGKRYWLIVRTKIFGANNERLDYLMDSFYKLSPEHRTAVLAGVLGLIVLFVLGAIFLYLSQVNALKRDLVSASAALHELQILKGEYQKEEKRYEKLIDTIDRKTKRMKFKPFFEKVAKDTDVQIEGLNEQKVPLSAENPLSTHIQEMEINLRFPKISVPRLLNFLVEIEKSNSLLNLKNLTIRGRFGTKLYFSGEAMFRGYSVEQ